jgi:hypothetical protein
VCWLSWVMIGYVWFCEIGLFCVVFRYVGLCQVNFVWFRMLKVGFGCGSLGWVILG